MFCRHHHIVLVAAFVAFVFAFSLSSSSAAAAVDDRAISEEEEQLLRASIERQHANAVHPKDIRAFYEDSVKPASLSSSDTEINHADVKQPTVAGKKAAPKPSKKEEEANLQTDDNKKKKNSKKKKTQNSVIPDLTEEEKEHFSEQQRRMYQRERTRIGELQRRRKTMQRQAAREASATRDPPPQQQQSQSHQSQQSDERQQHQQEEQGEEQEHSVSDDHRLVERMQEHAPPGVKITAPNFLLPSLVTHVVELELVKAWRTTLLHNLSSSSSSSSFSSSTNQHSSTPSSGKSDAVNSNLKSVSNITHWEVLGSVLVALYGDAEPTLVKDFLRRTVSAYGGKKRRTMADSLVGAHPITLSHRPGAGVTFVPTAALPEQLRFEGEEIETDDEGAAGAMSAARPPWAKRSDARWVCSTAQRPALVHFSMFDGHNDDEKQPSATRQVSDDQESLISFAGDVGLRNYLLGRKKQALQREQLSGDDSNNEQQQQQHKKSQSEPLIPRLGSLVHRHCLPVAATKTTATNRGAGSGSGSTPFTWYVLGAREAPQVFRTQELLYRAETERDQQEEDAGDRAAATKRQHLKSIVSKMHDQCSGDRAFGQVISGVSHISRLIQLPHHRSLFSRHHFVNRSLSKSKSASKSESYGDSSSSSDDDGDSAIIFGTEKDDKDLLFFDDHHREFFTPFLEGVPMQHVSISRASVTPFRGLDDFIHSRSRTPKTALQGHARPPRTIQRILDLEKSSSTDASRQQLSELDERAKEKWQHYVFGGSESAFDLDNDVRFARANIATLCLRERLATLHEFAKLHNATALEGERDDSTATDENSDSRRDKSRSASRLEHLLDAVAEKSRRWASSNGAKPQRKSPPPPPSSSFSSSLFDRFVRFTGGAPIGPNVTFCADTWHWAQTNFPELTGRAMQDRLSNLKRSLSHVHHHPADSASDTLELRRQATKRKLQDIRDAESTLGLLSGDKKKLSVEEIQRLKRKAAEREFARASDPVEQARKREQRVLEWRDGEVARLQELQQRGMLTTEEFDIERRDLEDEYQAKRQAEHERSSSSSSRSSGAGQEEKEKTAKEEQSRELNFFV